MALIPTLGPTSARVRATVVIVAGTLALTLAVGTAEARTLRKVPKADPQPATTAAPAKGKDGAAAKDKGGGKPTLVGTFGDWGTYEAQGPKSKICYALASPKERSPAALKRQPAYIFISSRPGEGVRNEISVILGFPVKEGSADAKAEIGSASFDLVTKGQNAWMKNAAQESQLIDTMKKHGRLVVKAAAVKGVVASDSYSLAGLGQALERVSKGCP